MVKNIISFILNIISIVNLNQVDIEFNLEWKRNEIMWYLLINYKANFIKDMRHEWYGWTVYQDLKLIFFLNTLLVSFLKVMLNHAVRSLLWNKLWVTIYLKSSKWLFHYIGNAILKNIRFMKNIIYSNIK